MGLQQDCAKTVHQVLQFRLARYNSCIRPQYLGRHPVKTGTCRGVILGFRNKAQNCGPEQRLSLGWPKESVSVNQILEMDVARHQRIFVHTETPNAV